ncbi:hypothetical protein D3C78_1576390 [compost metagenome]
MADHENTTVGVREKPLGRLREPARDWRATPTGVIHCAAISAYPAKGHPQVRRHRGKSFICSENAGIEPAR